MAFEYGFDTYSGFYRSFVRETGYTPSEYLRKFKAKKPYKINILQEEHIMINHKLITEILSNWDLQDQKVSDIVFPETGEISDLAYTPVPGGIGRVTTAILLRNIIKAAKKG